MKLKTLLSTFALVSAGVVTSFANPQVVMSTFSAGSSGNYRADPNADLSWVLSNYVMGKSTDGTWFGTFCLEKNEYFSPGSTYDVTLNNRAVGGGVSSPTVGYDIISQGTAYLYSQFAMGTLGGGFTYGNASSAATLQDWLWYLEGEQTNTGSSALGQLLITQFGSIAAAQMDYTGADVKVMNLTSNGGRTQNQDQLVYVGHVPDGGLTAILLGLGLLGIAFAKRKVRQA